MFCGLCDFWPPTVGVAVDEYVDETSDPVSVVSAIEGIRSMERFSLMSRLSGSKCNKDGE